MNQVYLASTNPGKLREFQEAAKHLKVELELLPGLKSLQPPVEDGLTFEENARIKAEYYSRLVPGKPVLAEDSGLSVQSLADAPGVYSARYAAMLKDGKASHTNSSDAENNAALIAQLERMPGEKHAGKYVCVIAVARDGKTLGTFYGGVTGELLTSPRGSGGFGYDPLFYFPALKKTFAELAVEEKRRYSHRGNAFRKFLEWCKSGAHQPSGVASARD
ncbi:MAG TPA: RdgB/HAM1 family non-canonical purine NTP pyrophosphatase [Terriglobales bacterium]|nr:RdgB/HAM1 family non-canonical purine NTP pyrophosphatase [Terriglobales bacterium]